jgi:aspartyl-tRNA synthetase
VMAGIFEKFAGGKTVTPAGEFPRIPYVKAMLDYGTDKPDLRNPLIVRDVTEEFRVDGGVGLFNSIIGNGGVVRAIPAPQTRDKPRSFFDNMNQWARDEGAGGLGYLRFLDGLDYARRMIAGVIPHDEAEVSDPKFDGNSVASGPFAKILSVATLVKIADKCGLKPGDGLFFAAGDQIQAAKLAGAARVRVGDQLELTDQNAFRFCWIIDFPFYEWDDEHKKVDFAHNPFSMPQGGLEALETQDPLSIKAYQYDMVCNGYELASGSIRNQHPDLMVKAFELTGLTQQDVEDRFGGMYRAFQYGAPPHGGMAAGVDRMVMLICGVQNLREITLFPMNQKAEDLLMGAPSPAEPRQLRELALRVVEPPKA